MNTVSPSVRCKVAIKFVELRRANRIETRRRLVEKDKFGIERQSPRQGSPLVMPPDSSDGYLLAASGSKPANSILSIASSSERRGDNRKCSRIGISTFCLTVRPENSAPC